MLRVTLNSVVHTFFKKIFLMLVYLNVSMLEKIKTTFIHPLKAPSQKQRDLIQKSKRIFTYYSKHKA